MARWQLQIHGRAKQVSMHARTHTCILHACVRACLIKLSITCTLLELSIIAREARVCPATPHTNTITITNTRKARIKILVEITPAKTHLISQTANLFSLSLPLSLYFFWNPSRPSSSSTWCHAINSNVTWPAQRDHQQLKTPFV